MILKGRNDLQIELTVQEFLEFTGKEHLLNNFLGINEEVNPPISVETEVKVPEVKVPDTKVSTSTNKVSKKEIQGQPTIKFELPTVKAVPNNEVSIEKKLSIRNREELFVKIANKYNVDIRDLRKRSIDHKSLDSDIRIKSMVESLFKAKFHDYTTEKMDMIFKLEKYISGIRPYFMNNKVVGFMYIAGKDQYNRLNANKYPGTMEDYLLEILTGIRGV